MIQVCEHQMAPQTEGMCKTIFIITILAGYEAETLGNESFEPQLAK